MTPAQALVTRLSLWSERQVLHVDGDLYKIKDHHGFTSFYVVTDMGHQNYSVRPVVEGGYL